MKYILFITIGTIILLFVLTPSRTQEQTLQEQPSICDFKEFICCDVEYDESCYPTLAPIEGVELP